MTIDWSEKKEVHIQIQSKHNSISICEVAGSANINNKKVITGSMEHQSESTPRLVSKLENYGTLDLPGIKESAELHDKLLTSLLPAWTHYSKSGTNILPIS
jgi:hypothetical protein